MPSEMSEVPDTKCWRAAVKPRLQSWEPLRAIRHRRGHHQTSAPAEAMPKDCTSHLASEERLATRCLKNPQKLSPSSLMILRRSKTVEWSESGAALAGGPMMPAPAGGLPILKPLHP